jgi:hypothetical protein
MYRQWEAYSRLAGAHGNSGILVAWRPGTRSATLTLVGVQSAKLRG